MLFIYRNYFIQEYEMQKEFEKQQKLQTLDDEHKKEYEKEIHDQEEKHKKHEPVNIFILFTYFANYSF